MLQKPLLLSAVQKPVLLTKSIWGLQLSATEWRQFLYSLLCSDKSFPSDIRCVCVPFLQGTFYFLWTRHADVGNEHIQFCVSRTFVVGVELVRNYLLVPGDNVAENLLHVSGIHLSIFQKKNRHERFFLQRIVRKAQILVSSTRAILLSEMVERKIPEDQ